MSTTPPLSPKALELTGFLDALERAAQAGPKALDQAFNSPPRGFSVHEIQPDHTLTRVSPGHTALLGYTPEDMVGRRPSEFVVLQETSERAMDRKLAPGALLLPFNRTWRRADGSEVTLLMLDRHLKDAEGQVIGIRTVIAEEPARTI